MTLNGYVFCHCGYKMIEVAPKCWRCGCVPDCFENVCNCGCVCEGPSDGFKVMGHFYDANDPANREDWNKLVRREIETYAKRLNGEKWIMIANGTTGYESAQLSELMKDKSEYPGWSACAGTLGRWSRLFIPQDQLDLIIAEYWTPVNKEEIQLAILVLGQIERVAIENELRLGTQHFDSNNPEMVVTDQAAISELISNGRLLLKPPDDRGHRYMDLEGHIGKVI